MEADRDDFAEWARDLDAWPAQVQDEDMRPLGAAHRQGGDVNAHPTEPARDRLVNLLAGIVAVAVVLVFVAGCIAVVRWLV